MNKPAHTPRLDLHPRLRWLLRSTRELDRAQRRLRKATIAWLGWLTRRCPYKSFDTDQALQVCTSKPLISLIVPIRQGQQGWLARCFESIQRQLYDRWELLVVPVGAGSPDLQTELQRATTHEPRIRICQAHAQRGATTATNQAILQAAGQFVGFLDPSHELSPDALLWMAVLLNRHPTCRWLYSDEATLDRSGNYAGRVQRKPAFSREYLLAADYASRLAIFDRRILLDVGGLRETHRGAELHDLTLRIADVVSPSEVRHIPELLYFRRTPRTTSADSSVARREAEQSALNAVTEAAARRKLGCRIEPDPADRMRFQIRLLPQAEHMPKVAVVIPTFNATAMLRRCIDSLTANTAYPNYEIVVIDNRSSEPELARYLGEFAAAGRGRTIRYPKPFNHSEMHNEAIAQLDAKHVVLLNNDVYAFGQGWLEQLVATIEQDPTVAGVGGKLFFPDGTLQHAGVVIGTYQGTASNVGGGERGDSAGYFGRYQALQQVSAVTAAMMILRKSAFLAVGGFDADRYPTSYNDVDLWLRLGDAGYRCLFNPAVQASHEESKTRGVTPVEIEYRTRLQTELARRGWRDPFWNLALFGNPDDLWLKERTEAWISEKIQALQAEVEALQARANSVNRVPSVPAPHFTQVRDRAESQTASRDGS